MSNIEIGLISSAAIVGAIAIVSIIIILIKVFKLKKQLKKDKENLYNELSKLENEQKMLQRPDLGEPIKILQELDQNSLDHEIVEFCINSCIRNNFKNVLLLGNNNPYEIITLSNKAQNKVFVIEDQFKKDNYDKINSNCKIEHQLEVISDNDILDKNLIFDAICLLQPNQNLLQYFQKYINNLKFKGMFIFANTKKNKESAKELNNFLEKNLFKYDILKWNSGFILVVNDKHKK